MNSPVVSIQCGLNPADTVKRALALQGGFVRLVRPGATVLIKPNYGVPVSWEAGATTHPDVVVGLIEAARTAGAGRITVAESAIVGFDAGRVMTELGVWQRFERAGARVVNLDEAPDDFVEKKIPAGKLLKRIKIFRQALECDVLVSVPVLKTHIYTTVSLGIKNLKGTLPDAQKKIMHRIGARKKQSDLFELDRSIADMMTVHSPDLTVIDATVGQEGFVQNAGICGNPVPLNSVLVGTDFVATDAVGAAMMGFDPLEVNHLRYCREMDLGRADIDHIQIVGEDLNVLRRPFRPAVPGELGDYEHLVVKEGGSCSGCSVAIRCALNSFAPQQLETWRPAVIHVGSCRDDTGASGGRKVFIGKCACRFAVRGDEKITGCPPPFTYVANRLSRALQA